MKKLGLLLLFLSSFAVAQEADSLVADSVERVPPAYYLGVYVDAALSSEPSAPERNILSSYRFGIQYNRWFAEVGITKQLGDYESFLIFPNVFSFRYRYVGAQISYNLLEGDVVDIRSGVGYHVGDMLWEFRDSGEDFVRDTFYLLKFFARAEYGKMRYLKPYVSLGYQRMSEVQVTSVRSSDFSGWNAEVGVRLGFF